MIPRSAITHWNKQVPWEDIANVEQDLIITRALTDIFSDEFLASELAFRGGTALHKLYLAPQPRYSEDIDLVQINPGPIKPILFRLGEVLDYLPDKVIKPKRFNNTMLFRIQSEIPPVVQIRKSETIYRQITKRNSAKLLLQITKLPCWFHFQFISLPGR